MAPLRRTYLKGQPWTWKGI